jgi:hypothetical protein
MIEEVALNYFRGLSKEEKKNLMRKIMDSLNDKEKLEIAKMIVDEKMLG